VHHPLNSVPSSQRHGQPRRLSDPFDQVKDDLLFVVHEGVVVIDEGLRIVLVNPAALVLFGCAEADVLGQPLARFIPDLCAQGAEGAAQPTPVSLQDCDRAPLTGLRQSGQAVPLEVTVCKERLHRHEGAPSYTTVLLHDASQELSLKARFDGCKMTMRAIFDLAPVATWITEGDLIVYANQACASVFGADDSQVLVGRPLYALLKPASQAAVREKVAQVLANGGTIVALQERIARLDGSERDVIISVAALPDHGQTTAQMVIQDITERTLESQGLARSRRALQRMSANLVSAREEERRRIARELHDELGQRLTALKMELGSLSPSAGQANRIRDMLTMVDETVAAVRRIATELRPLMLDDLGVTAAIESLARESERRMGLEITLALDEAVDTASEAVTIALYRMVQEALTNIARHAHATRAWIDLRQDASQVALTVRDNGVGFGQNGMYRDGSHGLVGMLERAHMLGGDMDVGTHAEGGGFIKVRLPINATDHLVHDLDPADAASPSTLRSST